MFQARIRNLGAIPELFALGVPHNFMGILTNEDMISIWSCSLGAPINCSLGFLLVCPSYAEMIETLLSMEGFDITVDMLDVPRYRAAFKARPFWIPYDTPEGKATVLNFKLPDPQRVSRD